MGSVQLVRRWGSHESGATVEVDDTMAAWLVGNSYAETEDRPGTASAGVLAPGSHGADLRAGGDLSRPGVPQWSRGPRVKNVTEDNPEGEHVNRGVRVAGAPKPVGDVSHVAPENLGSEHKEAGKGASTASEKSAPKSAAKGESSKSDS